MDENSDLVERLPNLTVIGFITFLEKQQSLILLTPVTVIALKTFKGKLEIIHFFVPSGN